MRISKRFLILLALYLVSLPVIYQLKASSGSFFGPQPAKTSCKLAKRTLMEESIVEGPVEAERITEGGENPVEFNCEMCEEHKIPPSSLKFWIFVLICLSLCSFAGLFSGLTVGYMGLDQLELEVKLTNGTENEKLAAKRIMPLLKDHHRLLATLLLGNALCFETLPIFMDAIMPSWAAILISTTFILILGEVVPQALCVGPQQLQIASASTPIVNFLMMISCCITVPIGKALDHFLGVHAEYRYDKKMLINIVGLHAKKVKEMTEGQELGNVGHDNGHGQHAHGPDQILDPEEFKIIQSTIELRDIKVEEIMVNLDKAFSVSADAQIDKSLLLKIAKRGYSKIPIYKGLKTNIVGIIPTKKFINGDEYIGSTIDQAYKYSQPTFIPRDQSLLELLSIFQKGNTQTVFVTSKTVKDQAASPMKQFNSGYDTRIEQNHEVLGLVTLKDLFERLCKMELKDDDEHIYSVVQTTRRKGSQRFGRQITDHGRNETAPEPQMAGGLLQPLNR